MINVQKQSDRILSYKLYDNENGAVIYYYLNIDKYQLIITGETTLSYQWELDVNQTFIQLMCRCGLKYIRNKLCKKQWDLEKTKEETLNRFTEYLKDLPDKPTKHEIKRFIQNVKSIDVGSFDMYLEELQNEFDCNFNNYDSSVNLDFEDFVPETEYIYVTSYQYWDQKAVELFINNVVPLLKIELAKENISNDNK